MAATKAWKLKDETDGREPDPGIDAQGQDRKETFDVR